MIRHEYYLVCDECSIYLGEDQGDDDYLTNYVIELIDYARDCGWHTNDLDHNQNICKTCWTTKKEDRDAASRTVDTNSA